MNAHVLSEQSWLAAYLYYNEPWESFLCEAVAPFVQKMLSGGLATQYFFIRYWEKGPHIRLRFKGNPIVLENKVKPVLTDHFSGYFAAHPSQRTDPAWLQQVPEAQQWLRNNSILFTDYEPETARYGGPDGLVIAEGQFKASSDVVLAVLQEKRDWDYNRALGVAIQLHLGFAFATGMDLPETANFFSQVFRNWLPRSYLPYGQHLSVEERMAGRDQVLGAFRQAYEKQKNMLLPLFTRTWKALENHAEFEQVWYNKWLQQLRSVAGELRQAQANGLITMPEQPLIVPEQTAGLAKQQLWAIYDSYIHMLNNRLGIMNRDEGYLGFLIKEVLTTS
jgi:thiopeptide-type bacteriocin biosynthesis protein